MGTSKWCRHTKEQYMKSDRGIWEGFMEEMAIELAFARGVGFC